MMLLLYILNSVKMKHNLHHFDYIKMGPYIEELGPLTSRTTNQRLYEIKHKPQDNELIDITHKFWK